MNIHKPASKFNAHSVNLYVDRLHFWIGQRLTQNFIKRLRLCCSAIHLTTHRARFDGSLVQLVQLSQPDEYGLLMLSRLNSRIHLNYAEIAADLIFDKDEEAIRLADFIRTRLRWRYGEARVVCHSMATTGRRWKNQKLIAVYADKPSKVDGQLGCCHVELQLSGHAVFQRMGLDNIGDFAVLDLAELLEAHIALVDTERLGIAWRNHFQKVRDPKPTISIGRGYTYNHSQRAGTLLIRAAGTMQDLLQGKHLPQSVKRKLSVLCRPLSLCQGNTYYN